MGITNVQHEVDKLTQQYLESCYAGQLKAQALGHVLRPAAPGAKHIFHRNGDLFIAQCDKCDRYVIVHEDSHVSGEAVGCPCDGALGRTELLSMKT